MFYTVDCSADKGSVATKETPEMSLLMRELETALQAKQAEIERLRAAISDAASLIDGHEQWGAERLLIANQLRAALKK